MIQLLIRKQYAEDHVTAKGCKEPLGKAFTIRHCNLIPLQASLQHVEVYNSANRLLSWAQDDTYDEHSYRRVNAAVLAAISHRWHLCRARSRWHHSSVLGVEERKYVLYLVPCNHTALVSCYLVPSPRRHMAIVLCIRTWLFCKWTVWCTFGEFFNICSLSSCAHYL